LYYGLGTMFSLAVLSVMVTLATDMVIAVAASFWTSALLGAGPDGVNSMALQQGGMGLVLTMLIMTAPPMAAMFFQGTLGSFVPYSQMNPGSGMQGARRDQMGVAHGSGGAAGGAMSASAGSALPSPQAYSHAGPSSGSSREARPDVIKRNPADAAG
jgi:type IV secretion system protein VirB6